MWFGAIFLAALATLGFCIAAYTCVAVRELAMPLGTVAVFAAAGAQLPGFVLLARRLDGDVAVTATAILTPMVASWGAMWLASLAIAAGLRWKEGLRARLAAAGRVWTADDDTARSVVRPHLAETQKRVDAMSDAQLAALTHTLMKVCLGGPQPRSVCVTNSVSTRTCGG